MHLGEARRLERAHPRQVERHHRAELVLLERFVEPAGAFERHRVVGARDLQVGMQLHRLAALVDRLGQLAAPHPYEHHRGGQSGQQRLDLQSALEHVQRLVESPERGVHQRAAHVARCRRSAARESSAANSASASASRCSNMCSPCARLQRSSGRRPPASTARSCASRNSG